MLDKKGNTLKVDDYVASEEGSQAIKVTGFDNGGLKGESRIQLQHPKYKAFWLCHSHFINSSSWVKSDSKGNLVLKSNT